MVRRIARLATMYQADRNPGGPDPLASGDRRARNPYAAKLRHIVTNVSVALQKGNAAMVAGFRRTCADNLLAWQAAQLAAAVRNQAARAAIPGPDVVAAAAAVAAGLGAGQPPLLPLPQAGGAV